MSVFSSDNPQPFEWVWNEEFWLPNNLTWNDLKDEAYGQPRDLFIVLPLTVILVLCRILVERVVAKRLGTILNISASSPKKPKLNENLEKYFLHLPKRPTKRDITKLSKQTDISERHLERWLRQYRRSERPSDMTKFCETFWRFTFYLSSSILGIYIVHDKSYIWNTAEFFLNHPQDHHMEQSYYLYYVMEMAFYCSLIVSQFSDIKRKDFMEMFIHHIATIMLISGSYITNFGKIGVVIMLVHDVSDIFLEFAKMAKYAKLDTTTTVGFILLSIAFVLTRLVILPFMIIRSVVFEGMVILKPFNGFLKLLFCSLVLLQMLHLYWFSFLLKTAYMFLKGTDTRDPRSESESSTIEENGVSHCNGNHLKNGTK